MERLKIGQIGRHHEHAVSKFGTLRRRMEDVFEIVGVVEDAPFMKGLTYKEYELAPFEGIPRLTLYEMLNYPGLDAVMVETPNADLVPIATMAMEHGLAIHMDKPTGADVGAYKRLLEGCAARGLPFQIGYMYRGNPAVLWCREALKQGWLGEIQQFEGSMNHNYGGEPYQGYLGAQPGGILYNLGCHIVDVAVGLLGKPRGVYTYLTSVAGYDETTGNNAVAVLEYPHAFAIIRASSKDPASNPGRRFRVVGTNATVDVWPAERFDGKPLVMELTLANAIPGYDAGHHVVDFGVTPDRYDVQLREFAAMIRGEAKSSYTIEHDLAVAEVVADFMKGTGRIV